MTTAPDAAGAADKVLLRVAQGALANVREHAKAENVLVILSARPDQTVLQVRDDGIGFRLARTRTERERGFGLPALRERIRACGGTLSLESTPNRGTVITAALSGHAGTPAADPPGRGPRGGRRVSGEPISILIVDDHAVVRAGLRALIESEAGTMHVVGEAAGGEQAVCLAAHLNPAVVLMDLRLDERDGGIDGAEATRRILTETPRTRVVVLASHSNRNDVQRALDAGARGYVLKAGPPAELFRAIHTAATGGLTLSPEAAVLHGAGRGCGLAQRS